MEQHPVPQHIASFEFKLFGNLTVRQFVTLAIPMSVAALIFFSQIPVVIRFILSGFFALLGLFAALVPVGGRPLDKWFVAFIKAIMSPTQRVWVKEPKIPEFLAIIVSAPKIKKEQPEPITAQDRQRLLTYLRSLPKGNMSSLDVKEQIAIERLNLSPTPNAGPTEGKLPPVIIWTTPTTPVVNVDSSSRQKYAKSLPQINTQQPTPVPTEEYGKTMVESLPPEPKAQGTISPHAKPYTLPGLERKLRSVVELIKTPQFHLASETNFSIENIIPIHAPGQRLQFLHGIGKTRTRKLHFAPPDGFDISKLPIRGERRFEISEELKKRFQFQSAINTPPEPKINQPKIAHFEPPKESQAEQKAIPKQDHFILKPQVKMHAADDISFKPQEKVVTDSQVSINTGTSTTTPLPNTHSFANIVPLTDRPNVVSGQVTTANDSPIEAAILTIRDQQNIPVRALKTNKLGQFLSATALTSGKYFIEIDTDQAHFEPVTLNLEGEILAPLQIRAKGGM